MATHSASTATSSASTETAESASAIPAKPPRSITQRWLFAAFLLAGIVGSLTEWSTSNARTGALFFLALAAVVVGGLRL